MQIYLIAINVLAFILYGIDKCKAQRGLWRISEAMLLGVAVLGGSIGAFLGMKLFHHKTRHPQFYIGLPVIFALQVALGILLLWKFELAL